jgi:hypothetical protein
MWWGREETPYLSVIVNNGIFRLAPDAFAVVRNRPLPKTQNPIKSFVQFARMVIIFTITLMGQRN